MKLKWTVEVEAEYEERDMNRLCAALKVGATDEDLILTIENHAEYLDFSYDAWGEEQTQTVLKEVKRRVGGIQLSMFDY